MDTNTTNNSVDLIRALERALDQERIAENEVERAREAATKAKDALQDEIINNKDLYMLLKDKPLETSNHVLRINEAGGVIMKPLEDRRHIWELEQAMQRKRMEEAPLAESEI